MRTCFVMQPFDRGKYDKLYVDVFEPAIRNAGLIPYRVDRDFSASDLKARTDAGIREAAICFAEITDNNPNVIFEVATAFAYGKDVVMISEGIHDIPFNLLYKPVTMYRSDTQQGLAELSSAITERLTALLGKSKNGRSTAVAKNNPIVAEKNNPNIAEKAAPSPPPAPSKPSNSQPNKNRAPSAPKQSPAQRRAAAMQNYRPSTSGYGNLPGKVGYSTPEPAPKKKSLWDWLGFDNDIEGHHIACS